MVSTHTMFQSTPAVHTHSTIQRDWMSCNTESELWMERLFSEKCCYSIATNGKLIIFESFRKKATQENYIDNRNKIKYTKTEYNRKQNQKERNSTKYALQYFLVCVYLCTCIHTPHNIHIVHTFI